MRRVLGDVAEASKYILGFCLLTAICLVAVALVAGLFVRVVFWVVGW